MNCFVCPCDQVDAKKQNAPSETKPLIVHKLSHHFSLGSLVKEAGSLVNEVKWNTFGSSFTVLDSGLGSEMEVKPTQNSISTALFSVKKMSGAVNLRKVNRVRGHWSASKSD
ncbi:hypothetical protein Bca52824_040226 [Brassica carinata]|uniref:Uncharacterized protein n=1 Tax=Brassica carinata TaxID=52824 RepID=A0A8X7RT43_BRACI|nr:hypothetical protein Bca52824_040226 [Brassica carinata]